MSRTLLIVALCAGYFLVLLDVTVVNVALPSIGADLGAGHLGLAWIVDGYAVPLAGLMLVAGVVGDRRGHRGIVLAGFAGFGVASVVCALAPTIAVLVAGRALQGIAAALVLPGTLALLTDLARDAADRARLIGAWAALGGIALSSGPLIGGLIVGVVGWRSVFWLNIPIVLAALVPLVRSSVGSSRRSLTAQSPSPDQTETAAPADSRAPAAPTGEPGASLPLLLLACGVAGLMNLSVLGTLLLLTQDLQEVRGLSPLAAGVATLPALLPLPLLGMVAGRMSARLGVWRASAVGLAIGAAGFAAIALSFLAEAALPWLLYPALALWGSGIGLLTPRIVVAAVHAAPSSPGLASGGSNTARQAGGAIGVAVFAVAAGSASAPAFAGRSALVILGAGVAFLITTVVCFIIGQRGQVSKSQVAS